MIKGEVEGGQWAESNNALFFQLLPLSVSTLFPLCHQKKEKRCGLGHRKVEIFSLAEDH